MSDLAKSGAMDEARSISNEPVDTETLEASMDEKYADIDGRSGDKMTSMEKHWKLLRDLLQFARIQEDEDALTDMYVDLLGPRGTKDVTGDALPLPPKHNEEQKILPMWEYNGMKGNPWFKHQSRFLSKKVSLKEKNEDALPKMATTTDKYTISTWYFLRARVMVEDQEIAKRGIRVFLNSILQLLTCATVWGLGSSELDGGRIEVVVASFAVGVVGIIAQIFGILGSLSENEAFLRKYWIAQLWLLSLIVTFLYTEIHHNQDNTRLCNPSSTDYIGDFADNSCARDEAVITAAIVMNAIQLFLSFLGIYNTTGMLDSINDRTSIEDNIHVFKYFQVYTSEMTNRLLAGSEVLKRNAE